MNGSVTKGRDLVAAVKCKEKLPLAQAAKAAKWNGVRWGGISAGSRGRPHSYCNVFDLTCLVQVLPVGQR